MHVFLRLLGGFEVVVDGRPVPARAWQRRSAVSLVKLLALAPGGRLRREQVIDALWPDLPVDDAGSRLHSAAHYARTALGTRDGVVLSGGSVALFPDADVTLDVAEFDRAAEGARDGRPASAEDALALYAGELLPDDVYESWAEEPRAARRLRHLELLRSAGRFEDLVRIEPLDEDAQLALARQHLRHGRRSAALRALDRMAAAFGTAGIEPGPAAAALRREAAAPPPGGGEPARAVPVRRSSLPAPRKRLIGRTEDVATLTELLRVHRVVSLTGPGGAGKSTLALAVARRLSGGENPAADVLLAELAPVSDRDAVLRTVAEAAGIQGVGAIELTRLAATLGPRPLLLLLDNCEHLLDDCAALVDAVLDAGPRARVLVTSREPLRVDGEAVHRLGSLGADSAELFAERAVAAAGPGVVDAGDPRVVELCRRLDGLPLAIELAAAQLAHLGLAELIDRLDDRLTLLVGGRPRAGNRHSALTATVEWSHQLLSAPSRELFARLGVFPASFDLAAVAAVAPDLEPVPNLLGDLVAKNMVVHDPAAERYSLLETLRLFAADRLDEAGRREQALDRLRRHVLARATAQSRARTWASMTTAAESWQDIDNVRLAFSTSLDAGDPTAAVDLALGISTLWRNAVSYAEGRRWVHLLHDHDLAPVDRLWAWVLEADIALGSSDPRLLKAAAAEAGRVAATVDDPGGAVVAALYGGLVHLVADPRRAVDGLQAARDRARQAGEPVLERVSHAFQTVARRAQGRSSALDDEVAVLIDEAVPGGEDRYIAIWAGWLFALVDRDGARLRRLMDAQLADVRACGLPENWLTTFSDAVALIAEGAAYLPELRQARQRAEAEGRQAEADSVMALSYAAACRDDWERAAELLGATEDAVFHDTASFIHHVLLRDQLVRPRLEPGVFAAVRARGAGLDLAAVLDDAGL